MTSVNPATKALSTFAIELDYDALPQTTRQTLRYCLIDAIACAAFGQQLPWSQSVLRVAIASGRDGRACLPGIPGVSLHPAPASLALGAFAHAFELDNLRKPGLGVHGGATVALPALAVAQHVGASGRDLMTAIAAGIEVMFRIGIATMHTPEKAGFHAPGLTGPFGAATAAARLLGASPRQVMDAYGISGSLSSGLMAFSKSEQGGMIKRLHLGRAAEGGVMAAMLAMEGFEGPHTVLDGRFGLLESFCLSSDAEKLADGLGEVWEADRICFKTYACHITAHGPLEALRQLRSEGGFSAGDIESIDVQGSDKMVSHHNIPEPADIMQAQYSIPYVVAASFYRDVNDPAVFDDALVADADVRAMASRVNIGPRSGESAPGGWAVDVTVNLKNGKKLQRSIDAFPGTPEQPFDEHQISAKFLTLAKSLRDPDRLLSQLLAIDGMADVQDLALA